MIFFNEKKMIVLCSTQQIQITRDLPYHKNKKMDLKKYLKKAKAQFYCCYIPNTTPPNK